LPERTGVVLLALRRTASTAFVPNPSTDVLIGAHSILIALGTPAQLLALRDLAEEPASVPKPAGEHPASGRSG
jgi:uncharacterized protein with PhoU and TrkA domain